jgi:isopentenyl phosphate kinase
MKITNLTFLKLGGSLITDKSRQRTARQDIIDRIAFEIAASQKINPGLRLVLGHGSGSFGHIPAHQHQTRLGVTALDQWHGFAEVWHEARLLNQIMLESLYKAGLPVLAFPPSACAITSLGKVVGWDVEALQAALTAHLIPVVNGDVVFDRSIGGTILSTEDVFSYLARQLKPKRILLAGIEPGVWADFPARTRLIPDITPADKDTIAANVSGSAAVDVTGGMADKVHSMLTLIGEIKHLEVMIFSGEGEGQIERALGGASFGTVIRALRPKE